MTFHRLDDAHFLDLMARCQGLVTTAGFESVAEAMLLGTPVLTVPVEGHFEQRCNSLDAEAAGAGLAASAFDLDRFVEFIASYGAPGSRFRRWVASNAERFVREVEAVAEGEGARPAAHADPEGAAVW